MSKLKEAIEEITYRSKYFLERAFRIISENREEAIPYLREAVKYANEKRTEIDEDYQLHFYALYLLG